MSQKITNRNRWKKLHIDNRTEKDIERRIIELSDSYETGWHPDESDPDIGLALTKIYANQMKENIDRTNDVLDRYHTEFVNMLDISLLPAKPASGIVICELVSDSIPGIGIPKGSQLVTGSGQPLIFEADHAIYATSSVIAASFMTNRKTGAIIPLKGEFVKPEIVPGLSFIPEEEKEAQVEEGEEIREAGANAEPPQNIIWKPTYEPFRLFGEGEGIDQNIMVFYHKTVFDVEDNDIFVRFDGNERLVKRISDGEMTFSYITNDGVEPVSSTALMDDGCTFLIQKKKENKKITIQNEVYSVLLLSAKQAVEETEKVKRISFASSGKPVSAENVNNGTNDCNPDRFDPFGEELALYNTCYICHDNYFSKAGSDMTITFDVSYDDHRMSLTPEEEAVELKIIKRKPVVYHNDNPAFCTVQEVAIEYFNGTGWKRLPISDQRAMFESGEAAKVTLEFVCPEDWAPTGSGAYEGRAIRMQVTKADNCYMRPAVHTYPHIRNLKISYTYEAKYEEAQRMEAIIGTRRFDLTASQRSEKGYLTFRRGEYEEDALYIGFSERLDNGPISLLFQLEDGTRYDEMPCHFEYFTRDGFHPIKVLDYTQIFTRSGVVMFMPPSDMQRAEIEDHKLFWIRIVRHFAKKEDEDDTFLPLVDAILLNALQVSNIETLQETDYYIDEVLPNPRFSLGITNILDANVWVNELGRHSRDTMLAMEAEHPESVRMEYDILGQITGFYVKWEETQRLETSENPRCYLLDRLQNSIMFGDGIHTWTPKVTEGTALRVQVRRCNGQLGNVDVNAIDNFIGNMVYVGTVYNPVKAYGGSNIESIDSALERGSSILSSRNRLVTMRDYEYAILSYSDTIDQVAGIVGRTVTGRVDDSEISFILLMKDFMDGSYAFHRIVGALKRFLLESCELTVVSEKLHVVEPIFVSISVSVWVNIVNIDDSFEIQGLMEECLDEFLNPLGYYDGHGWKIGTLPKKSQLLMRLNVLKSKAIVKKAVMIAKYKDEGGIHEMDLEDVEVNPFMLCTGGEYKVHILY